MGIPIIANAILIYLWSFMNLYLFLSTDMKQWLSLVWFYKNTASMYSTSKSDIVYQVWVVLKF